MRNESYYVLYIVVGNHAILLFTCWVAITITKLFASNSCHSSDNALLKMQGWWWPSVDLTNKLRLINIQHGVMSVMMGRTGITYKPRFLFLSLWQAYSIIYKYDYGMALWFFLSPFTPFTPCNTCRIRGWWCHVSYRYRNRECWCMIVWYPRIFIMMP